MFSHTAGLPCRQSFKKLATERNQRIVLVVIPIGSMYGIYANIGGILMVNVTIYNIHGSYGICYLL